LEDTKFELIVFVCPGTDISAAVKFWR